MRFGIFCCFAFVMAGTVSTASPATLDEIVQRHLEARGGEERVRAIDTLVYRDGTYREEHFTGSGHAFMAFSRPFFRVVGDPEDDSGRFREGYDGSAWEWYANPGVVLRTVGPAAGATRRGADFDGPFIDTIAKGYEIVLDGETRLGERPVWGIRVTYPDRFVKHLYIDRESFLEIGNRYEAPFHAFGDPVVTETRFEDFRRVDGVLFPFRSREVDLDTGKTLSEMQWGAIEINRKVPQSWFSPPSFERSREQVLLEQLYYERTDSAAVLITYHQFRRAWPDTEVAAGIAMIGYQILKMGETSTAVALLKANSADHPMSADASFALGRALAAAGNPASAEVELRRTLQLDPKHARAKELIERLGRSDQ